MKKEEIKTGYVIMSTMTYYPTYYSKTVEDRHKRGFSIFITEDEALDHLPAALYEMVLDILTDLLNKIK